MSAKLNSGKGAVSTGVFSSLQHAYSKIGKDLYHFLIENPLKAQAANGAAIRTAGKAVVNAFTYGELHNTLYHPKPKPILQTGNGGNGNGANVTYPYASTTLYTNATTHVISNTTNTNTITMANTNLIPRGH